MLKRSISFPLLLLYGLGTTVGAGIYALMGPVAGNAGGATPLAFVIAAGLATLTALSFAELSARHPRSAGEAVYVREAFGQPMAASLVGLFVAFSGSVSAATITRGFAGYWTSLVPVPEVLAIGVSISVLTLVAIWGIRESVTLAAIITAIEIGGLLFVVWAARESLGEIDVRWTEFLPSERTGGGGAWAGVFAGALLAFYAFLGFEDMVNVAEEVKQVRWNLPVAIISTLALTTLLYFLVAATAVLTVDPEVLAESTEPLALVYRTATGRSASAISIIAMLAMLNGALIQIVMASRVLYGLAGEPLVPRAFGEVSSRTRTPHRATLVAGGVVLAMALFFPIEELAAIASSITLLIFALVNAALIRLRKLDPEPDSVSIRIPALVPWLGMLCNLGFLAYAGFAWWTG